MVTSDELKEMLKSREPLEAYDSRTNTWGRYAYIKEIVTQWDGFHKKFIVLAVCEDMTLRSSVQRRPDELRRITGAAAEPDAKSEEEVRREIQQRTLETIREAAKRHKW